MTRREILHFLILRRHFTLSFQIFLLFQVLNISLSDLKLVCRFAKKNTISEKPMGALRVSFSFNLIDRFYTYRARVRRNALNYCHFNKEQGKHQRSPVPFVYRIIKLKRLGVGLCFGERNLLCFRRGPDYHSQAVLFFKHRQTF